VVVVVPHRSGAARLKSVLDRLDLLGIRPIGYVYNFAPSRQDVFSRRTLSRLARGTKGPRTWKRRSGSPALSASTPSESESRTVAPVIERAERLLGDLARTMRK
jgi:hypothetical protein